MKRVAFMLASCLVGLAPASATAPPASDLAVPAPSTNTAGAAADEAEYLARFKARAASIATGQGVDSYDPTVPVAGKPDAGLLRAGADERTISSDALAEVTRYAKDNNTSGLIVWRNGKIELEIYFGANDEAALVNSRSFAKPLTAIAIGRALALGKIKSVDQPVADFIPQWRDDPVKSKILLRHLLDMRTGFQPQTASFGADNILNRAYLHPHHDSVIINDYPVVTQPGTRFDYANAAAEMIAPVIEVATGRSYAEFLGTEIFGRIGASGGKIWINRKGGMAHSGCCILLPARDWLRLSVLLLNDGKWMGEQLLPIGFVDEMRQGTAQNPHYGMGVWLAGDYIAERGLSYPNQGQPTTLHSEPYAAADLFLFDGNANQVSYIIPSENLVILRMGTSPPKGSRWDNSRLPNTILRGIVVGKGGSIPQRKPN